MVAVVFYFHAHQPIRIRKYRVFDIGSNHYYWDDKVNKYILDRVVRKCYKPMGELVLKMIDKWDLKVSYSITGTLIEQLEKWHPEIINLFKDLVNTGNVEIVGETYYHSLASIFSEKEFKEQIKKHRKLIKEVFNYKPKVVRNTELIYRNDFAKVYEDLGFIGTLAEGHEKVLGWRSPTYLYKAKNSDIKILFRHYRLSDDISFRFSTYWWEQFPLTADKFAAWINSYNGNGYVVNLFMDYETFGEHQWPETGIFQFFEHLIPEILKHPDNYYLTVSEAMKKFKPVDEIDVPFVLSWADIERDLSAWLGDTLQGEAARVLFNLEKDVKIVSEYFGDKSILEDWRKLTTSDHLYFMSLKYSADGDIHKYFREEAFETPYDAFISFMNILQDLKLRVEELKEKLMEKEPGKYEKLFLGH